MAHKRVTMQNLADACGLSRNTVSKVFNDRGAVPEATKKMVLQKAQEIGYLQMPYLPVQDGEAAPSPAAPKYRPDHRPHAEGLSLRHADPARLYGAPGPRRVYPDDL